MNAKDSFYLSGVLSVYSRYHTTGVVFDPHGIGKITLSNL